MKGCSVTRCPRPIFVNLAKPSLNIHFNKEYQKYLNNDVKANIFVNKVNIKKIDFNQLGSDILI